jgi:multidrug resistance efflux pump
MSLDAANVNSQLSYSTSATANLKLSCQGIIDSHIAPSDSPWYGDLNSELQQAKALAQEWQTKYDTTLKSDVLTRVVQCGQAFLSARANINQLFDQASSDPDGAKAGLQVALGTLKAQVQIISATISSYEIGLRGWGQRLNQVHGQMSNTIGQIQAQENDLQSQIASINSNIALLQAEIINDRSAIAEAESHRTEGIVETIFGVIFAPFTGGLSLILAGIGVSSIAEAQSKVAAMESTINDYQTRIVSTQQNLTQDQAQLVSLNGLTFSAGIALSDIDVAAQMLDTVRTSWDAFFQEMDDVITKITHAQDAKSIIVEKVWFTAACNEWDLIVTGTQGLIGVPLSTNSVLLDTSDIPVIRIVPTASHPPVPSDLKVSPMPGPNDLSLSPDCPVLAWGDYTYWAVDHADNRVAMRILGFDASNRIVKQLEKQGARYIWQMTLDQSNDTLTCYGQANNTITVALSEIQMT